MRWFQGGSRHRTNFVFERISSSHHLAFPLVGWRRCSRFLGSRQSESWPRCIQIKCRNSIESAICVKWIRSNRPSAKGMRDKRDRNILITLCFQKICDSEISCRVYHPQVTSSQSRSRYGLPFDVRRENFEPRRPLGLRGCVEIRNRAGGKITAQFLYGGIPALALPLNASAFRER